MAFKLDFTEHVQNDQIRMKRKINKLISVSNCQNGKGSGWTQII